MDSPRGPAFQGERWDDPRAFSRSARACAAAGEPANRVEDALTAGALLTVLGAVVLGLRRRRKP